MTEILATSINAHICLSWKPKRTGRSRRNHPAGGNEPFRRRTLVFLVTHRKSALQRKLAPKRAEVAQRLQSRGACVIGIVIVLLFFWIDCINDACGEKLQRTVDEDARSRGRVLLERGQNATAEAGRSSEQRLCMCFGF